MKKYLLLGMAVFICSQGKLSADPPMNGYVLTYAGAFQVPVTEASPLRVLADIQTGGRFPGQVVKYTTQGTNATIMIPEGTLRYTGRGEAGTKREGSDIWEGNVTGKVIFGTQAPFPSTVHIRIYAWSNRPQASIYYEAAPLSPDGILQGLTINPNARRVRTVESKPDEVLNQQVPVLMKK